jgi:hypothetical protein
MDRAYPPTSIVVKGRFARFCWCAIATGANGGMGSLCKPVICNENKGAAKPLATVTRSKTSSEDYLAC